MRSGNSPSYLIKEPYSYYFRIVVPKKLQPTIAKKELRYSLKTGNLHAAKNKARYFAGQFQLFFKDIQRGRFKQMNLTKEQIDKLIKEHKERLFEHYDKPVQYGQYDGKLDPEANAAAEYQWLEYTKKDLHNKRIAGDYSEIEKIADKILIKMGIASADIDKSSDEYSTFLFGLMRAELKGLDRYERNLKGEFDDELEVMLEDRKLNLPKPSPAPVVNKSASAYPGPLLSEFMEVFRQTKTNWKPSTIADYETAKGVILKILGDVPVGTLDRATMVNYRETLLKVPAYWTIRHKNMTVSDLPVPGADTLASDTITKNISFVSQLMDYAVDKEYLNESPMPKSKMSLPDDKTDVHSFTDDQVKIIMEASREFDDHRHWIPRLGYYTGCRLNELCQLHKEDLKEKDGIWYLDINENGKRTLKNKNSKRMIPVHPVLIEMGFINYAQGVDHYRIFPGCKYREKTKKYRGNFSAWFARLLANNGIKEKGDRSITFHSFRHRIYTSLKREGVDHEHVDQIAGHGLSKTKNRTYHHGYELSALKADVEMIPDHRII